jgi:glycosyltransferase involved in cell wall biosynthesis
MKDPASSPPVPISVVICTADRPDTIARAVQSALDQSHPEFEVLVVDQSRDARTEDIVVGLRADAGRLRYLRLAERGLSRAYNRGVTEARHELLAFTDDDCVAPEGWLAAIAGAFAEQPDVGLLYGQVLGPVEPEHRVEGGVIPTLAIPRLERLSRKDGFRVFGMGANFAARRSLVLRLGGFDEVLGGGGPLQSAQDFDFAYRVHREGEVILLDPRVAVHHYGFRSHADWPATVGSYGVGVGGFYLKHVRAGDVHAMMLLGRVLSLAALRLAKRVVLAQPTRLYRTYLRHLAVGMWRSRGYRVDRQLRLYR